MTHIMIDLETWGRVPGCAIRSLGAVVMDFQTGELGATFYANIDDASCEAYKLTRDPETVAWWREQSKGAQAALIADQRPLGTVLPSFSRWWAEQQGQFVWGHGASFDPPILEAAYAACFLDAPWKFWDVRCCRTVLAMANRRPERFPRDVQHNALDDAKAQARAVIAAFRYGQFNPS